MIFFLRGIGFFFFCIKLSILKESSRIWCLKSYYYDLRNSQLKVIFNGAHYICASDTYIKQIWIDFKTFQVIYKLIVIKPYFSFKAITIISVLITVKFSQTLRLINMWQNGGVTPHTLHHNASPRAGYTA